MPRGQAPPWAMRKEPVLDHLIMASINQAGGKFDPSTGEYATLRYVGIETRERAQEIKRALFRCALWLHKHGHASVSMSADIKREGTGYVVEFRAVDKTMAKKHVLEKYGPDRSRWPYDPRRKGSA